MIDHTQSGEVVGIGAQIAALDTRPRERVLVADEDVASAIELSRGLARLGHEVSHVRTGGELIGGLKEASTPNVVLSATLSDIGAEPLCRRLRSFSPELRIIVTLPSLDELDTVLCLEAGADDCVSRPYRAREVMARLTAIGRRQQHAVPVPGMHLAAVRAEGDCGSAPGPSTRFDSIECGNLRLDLPRREVRIGEISVELTRKEFDLLALLLEHRSFVVSRELIAERVWNGTWSRRTIDTHVASLRAKLDHPTLIRTVRGVGFKISA